MSESHCHDRLRTELLAARSEYFKICEKFDELASAVGTRSHGMEHPDGVQAIRNLANERKVAYNKYQRLLANLRPITTAATGGDEETVGERLTPREREVLMLIAGGKSTKEIAQKLGISFKTAVCHRSRILDKLYAHNTADLTRAAIRMGLIEP